MRSLSTIIDKKILACHANTVDQAFSWNSWVHSKLNICIWRVFLNRLSTRSNLSRRAIQLLDLSSVFCDSVETLDHYFYTCLKFKIIWLKIWSWWKAPPISHPSLDDNLNGSSVFSLNKRKSKIFHAVCMTLMWIKMRALLIQHGCEAALEVLPVDMEAQTKAELNKKAHSVVILCLDIGTTRLDHGFKMFIPHDTQSGKVKVINGSRVVLSGIRRDNCIYSLDGHAMAGELNASVEEKDSLAQVWHKRLGHISEAGLQVLEKHGLFGKKSLGELIFCENYVLGKSHQVESLGGKRYFLSIVDDYSRRLWVYILMFKHEGFGKFKEWKQLVENQTGRTVKKLRTDNGLEFCNQEFEQLCIESGIARYLTVAKTLQQNGLAECMNITLMDKVRCLLIQYGLPKTFWAEASCTAAYLINRSPSTAIEKNTPMKMWWEHPSDHGMLMIYGCVAYPHDKQGKLEPKTIKCILLGYFEGVKGYRLYRLDDESPKIVTSRNVVFNESVMYKDMLKDSGACAYKFVKELQVEVELQRLNNHTPEEDQTDQEDDDDEDAGIKKLIRNQVSHIISWLRIESEGQERNPQGFERVIWLLMRLDGFSEEEQDLRVSRSFSWAKAGEFQMAVQDKGRE
nr:retrovirus-related Pol polyprotein from transposon TNT 1-94 [Tanacetum cinerariifolium]